MNELCFMSNLSSAELAAWTQAIGSIAAIAVGAFTVWWQVRRAEAARRDDYALAAVAQRERRDQATIGVLRSVWVVAYTCRVWLEIWGIERYNGPLPNAFTSLIDSVSATPLLSIQDPTAIITISMMLNARRQLHDKMNADAWNDTERGSDFRDENVREIVRRFRAFEPRLRQLLLKLGADIPLSALIAHRGVAFLPLDPYPPDYMGG